MTIRASSGSEVRSTGPFWPVLKGREPLSPQKCYPGRRGLCGDSPGRARVSLACPEAPLTKSLECGCLFPPTMFLWLVSVQRTLTRFWGVGVGLLSVLAVCEDRKCRLVLGWGLGLTPGLDEASPSPPEASWEVRDLPF